MLLMALMTMTTEARLLEVAAMMRAKVTVAKLLQLLILEKMPSVKSCS